MSKYFAYDPGTGKHEDIVWRKHPAAKTHPSANNITLFYLGDKMLGQIHKLSDGYSAISHYGDPKLNWLGGGFKTRWAATEFILRVGGFRERP